jgi:hypothetical protein
MAIQISGTNVIDNSRNLTNTVNITASGTISGDIVATQAQAETGTDNTKLMTPLRVAEAITALGGGMVDDDINWSACAVGCTVRGGGNVFYKSGGIIWIVAPSTTQVGSTWPMGYCNGDSGATPNQAQRITGRSGWFIPDLGMLQTAYSCRTYWDTYSTTCYWSSTERNLSSAYRVYFCNNGNTGFTIKNLSDCVRPFRVVCY